MSKALEHTLTARKRQSAIWLIPKITEPGDAERQPGPWGERSLGNQTSKDRGTCGGGQALVGWQRESGEPVEQAANPDTAGNRKYLFLARLIYSLPPCAKR